MSEFVKGATILTVGLFLSKLLGLIYVFPFYAIVGVENVGLYQYAYIPYNIMLSIAISGLPLAVSKFVSKHNALGDYNAGFRLMKSGVIVMFCTGIVSFILLNLLATPIAGIVISDDEQIYTVAQIAEIIRWVSFALLVVPFMSLVRGFFQGYHQFMPTSVSQLIEQIVRIIVLLGGAFLVVKVFNGEPATALNFAVFAAFVGALAGIVVLYFYWKKFKGTLYDYLNNSNHTVDLSYGSIYKEVLKYSIPFVFVGLASSLFQLIDMLTFNRAMSSIGLAKVTDIYFTMINFTTQKIVMIPVMIATGLSMAIIPMITKFYTISDRKGLREVLDKGIQILLFVMLPAVVGIMLLAPEIYHALYEQSDIGAKVLLHYAPVAILFGLFSLTAAILQGINFQKWIMFSLSMGILVKLVLNVPLIKMLEVDGAILATALGYIVTIVINFIVITKKLFYNWKIVRRRILLIVIMTVLMGIGVYVVKLLLTLMFAADTRFLASLHVLIGAIVGLMIYGFVSFKLGIAQLLLGAKVTKLANKLGIK